MGSKTHPLLPYRPTSTRDVCLTQVVPSRATVEIIPHIPPQYSAILGVAPPNLGGTSKNGTAGSYCGGLQPAGSVPPWSSHFTSSFRAFRPCRYAHEKAWRLRGRPQTRFCRRDIAPSPTTSRSKSYG